MTSRDGPRLTEERKTIRCMIEIYCRGEHHGRGSLCPECGGLLDYAMARLDVCPFGEEKPTCRNCMVHCYDAEHRERVRAVMRYAGPRMIYTHPLLALSHMMNGRL